jgi:hypothetical protein
VPRDQQLPLFYLTDSIIKNLGAPFPGARARVCVTYFVHAEMQASLRLQLHSIFCKHFVMQVDECLECACVRARHVNVRAQTKQHVVHSDDLCARGRCTLDHVRSVVAYDYADDCARAELVDALSAGMDDLERAVRDRKIVH